MSSSNTDALRDLCHAFGKIVCIILIGYLCGRRKYITFKKQTLAQLLSKLILPVVFFYSMATMALHHINPLIALLGLFSRLVMMLLYYIPVHYLYNTDTRIVRLQYWAMSTLFVTMSYDIPIGYPIAEILWSEEHRAQYVLTWAALSKIFVMSTCIAMLNYCHEHTQNGDDNDNADDKHNKKSTISRTMTGCRIFLKHCVLNPIIIGIFCGLIVNVICHVALGMDSIPTFLAELCLVIKNAYPFSALFLIGYGIAESTASMKHSIDPHQMGMILLLVVGKCFVSPIVFYCNFMYLIEDASIQQMAVLACFYGMLPVSASPTVLSIQYSVYNDVIEYATVICLVVTAPVIIAYIIGINLQGTAMLDLHGVSSVDIMKQIDV